MTLTRKKFLTQGVISLGDMLLSVRELLKGAEPSRLLRPPGFVAGREAKCGECGSCRSACPQGVIDRPPDVIGPVLDFSAHGCRFCYLCIAACPTGVVVFPGEGEHPRLGIARPGDGCLAGGGCFTCSERCPEGAIDIVWGAGVSVDSKHCTGCGTCEWCCPVTPKAIRVEPL